VTIPNISANFHNSLKVAQLRLSELILNWWNSLRYCDCASNCWLV